MTKSIVFLIGCVLLCFSLIPAHTAHAATFDVCTLGELTTAITTANTNTQADIINFNCSTTLNFSAQVLIESDDSNPLTINASGNTVIFDGGDTTRFFRLNIGANLTVNGITFQNGDEFAGGAIFTDTSSTLTIISSIFTGNSASTSSGGAIVNNGTLTITNSTFTNNSAVTWGGAIYANIGTTTTITNTAFSTNSADFGGAVDNFGTLTLNQNTFINNSATTGGGAIRNFGTASSQNSLYQNNTCTENAITDNGANSVNNAIGCPGAVLVTPITPIPLAPTVTVLGCALDTADGVEVANAPDNTYCRVLMRNGGVVSYSGAIPAQLINLGVILAVDVYRLEGGMSVNTFPNYARVCLAGAGRLFYMDSRNAPRVSIELATETDGSLTCGWIPAPGTLILTN